MREEAINRKDQTSLPDIMTLGPFRALHHNQDIVVCGCGESLKDLVHPEQFITIGVNDVGRLFQPTYLVVVNPRRQFAGDRFRYIESSQSRYLFTQLDLGINRPNIVRFQLGTYGGTDISNPTILHYTQNSPYVALCLAALMGAKRIGLIGVDFTDDHFFGKTGPHVLVRKLPLIDAEYRKLNEALRRYGIEVYNLSSKSRLKAFPLMPLEEFRKAAPVRPASCVPSSVDQKRVFFVHYDFLSCGDVFTRGLQHAAEDSLIPASHAHWDDPGLPEKVREFKPDLIFVVHGRKFAAKWGRRFDMYNTAVWLLDEPYEVDDTSRYSRIFRTVFTNDSTTLARHTNAHYLPTCFAPRIHFPMDNGKPYDVGFVGGNNPTRRRILIELSKRGLLSYVVGGPWNDAGLEKICQSNKLDPMHVAALYQQTKIVLNIFRDKHHYNTQNIPATSLNPRVFEALACGALVISENRAEARRIFPEMPVFSGPSELVKSVRALLENENEYMTVREACYGRTSGHSYTDRLKSVLQIACNQSRSAGTAREFIMSQSSQAPRQSEVSGGSLRLEEWEDDGGIVGRGSDREYVLEKSHDVRPGSERGLLSKKPLTSVDLTFEVSIGESACFVAKIHQTEKFDHLSDSYHVMCNGASNYFARHDHIFKTFNVRRNVWEKIRLVRADNWISVYCNDTLIVSAFDGLLQTGYAFLGVKGGRVLLRNISLGTAVDQHESRSYSGILDGSGFTVCHSSRRSDLPVLSIVTTVFDRVECLRNCIRSVKDLRYRNYEHIIVADAPGEGVASRLEQLVAQEDDGQMIFVNLTERHNDWGITPASVGLHLARGKYICFLSDDNGYVPDHFDYLIPALEKTHDLGFVYSSCVYAGRRILNHPRPAPGRIDLGQPVFRKTLFDEYLQGKLPFNMSAWDWHMIEAFLRRGVKYQHVDRATFLFRLAACHEGKHA